MSNLFNIASRTEGQPLVGINYIKPAFQTCYAGAPVNTWALKQVGDHTYRLTIGGYPYTGMIDGKVTASINPEDDQEWHATYREDQDGYTIEPVNDQSIGWTVDTSSSDNPVILIKPIVTTHSDPPKFLLTQLFWLEPIIN